MDFREMGVQIPEAREWESVTPLTHRGIGQDKKFLVNTKAGRKLLLRVADVSEYETKKRVFELSTLTWQKSGVPMPEPIAVGKSRDKRHTYIVLSWLEGVDFDVLIPSLSQDQQYERGLETGRMLRRIHDSTASREPANDWQSHIGQRLEELLHWYDQFGESMPHDTKIIDYLHGNLSLMRGRPQAILHNDYHMGNLILQPDGKLGIIDFDFIRIGDPIEETRSMLYTLSLGHTRIVNGQLNGYFDGQKPSDEFFQVMAFYAALGLFASMEYQARRGNDKTSIAARAAEGFARRFAQFNGFRDPIPTWYAEP